MPFSQVSLELSPKFERSKINTKSIIKNLNYQITIETFASVTRAILNGDSREYTQMGRLGEEALCLHNSHIVREALMCYFTQTKTTRNC